MIEGTGSGAIFLTNGFGSGRPKNIWILRMDPTDPDPEHWLKGNLVR